VVGTAETFWPIPAAAAVVAAVRIATTDRKTKPILLARAKAETKEDRADVNAVNP